MTSTINRTVVTSVNIYRASGQWCYAASTTDGFDHSDTLGIADASGDDDAIAEAQAQFPDARIVRVDDVR